MGKNLNIRLKLKERLGILSLAVVLSLILFFISLIFSDAFSSLFFAFIKEDKKPEVIWIENRIDTKEEKPGSKNEPDSPSDNPPHN